MPHRLTAALDIGAVLSAHAAAIIISLSNVTDIIKIVSLLLAIGYTCWKWRVDYKHHIKKRKK